MILFCWVLCLWTWLTHLYLPLYWWKQNKNLKNQVWANANKQATKQQKEGKKDNCYWKYWQEKEMIECRKNWLILYQRRRKHGCNVVPGLEERFVFSTLYPTILQLYGIKSKIPKFQIQKAQKLLFGCTIFWPNLLANLTNFWLTLLSNMISFQLWAETNITEKFQILNFKSQPLHRHNSNPDTAILWDRVITMSVNFEYFWYFWLVWFIFKDYSFVFQIWELTFWLVPIFKRHHLLR